MICDIDLLTETILKEVNIIEKGILKDCVDLVQYWVYNGLVQLIRKPVQVLNH